MASARFKKVKKSQTLKNLVHSMARKRIQLRRQKMNRQREVGKISEVGVPEVKSWFWGNITENKIFS